jgi:hypothetical protein
MHAHVQIDNEKAELKVKIAEKEAEVKTMKSQMVMDSQPHILPHPHMEYISYKSWVCM